MRNLLLSAAALAAIAAPVGVHAQAPEGVTIERPRLPVRVQLDAVPTGALVTLLMRDIMKVPYVIASDVLQDRSPVSVNLVMPRREIPQRVIGFLRDIGLKVELVGGTVYVSRSDFGQSSRANSAPQLPGQISPAGSPMLSGQVGSSSSLPSAHSPVAGYAPATSSAPVELPPVLAVITLGNRQPSDIAEVVRSALPSLEVSARGASEPADLEVMGALSPAKLVLSGPELEVRRGVELVRQLDFPLAAVEVSATILELSDRKNRTSALQVIGDILSSSIGLNLGEGPAGNSLTVSVGGASAILSAVREDGRFSVSAEPKLLVRSGGTARLNAGAEVPTLGAVTFTDGVATRSVVYRQSGVTLEVSPFVIGDRVALSIKQERSSFVRTNTGVEDSPTRNQTSVSTQFELDDGQSVLIAGLEEKKESNTRSGFFGGLLGGRGMEKSNSQLVLLLEARIVAPRAVKSASVVYIGVEEQVLGSDNDGEAL